MGDMVICACHPLETLCKFCFSINLYIPYFLLLCVQVEIFLEMAGDECTRNGYTKTAMWYVPSAW